MMSRREGRSVAIDFRLPASHRDLQLRSRKFAKEVLLPAIEAETLPTPEQRFAATKPAYEAMIAAGFLRKCIPVSAGGESAGLTDTAIMVEELYAVNASVALTLIGTVLGLLPLLIGGTEQQRSRLLPPFLKQAGAPLAAFCATEPGGSANVASPPPGEGVRTTARFSGDRWIIQGRKSWVSHVTRGEAAFIPSSSIKRSGMHWRMQRWRSRRPAPSAGAHARRSICNRLPQRNWRSRQRS